MSSIVQVQRFTAPPIDASRAFLRRHPTLRRLLRPWLRRLFGGAQLQPKEISNAAYRRWIEDYDTLTDADRAAIRAHISALPDRPVISILMPVYNPPEALLREAIASVRAQLYPHWQLCIADDASPSPHVAPILRQAAAEDTRIRWTRRPENGQTAAATNSALALASGTWVALMDHDDLLPEHALYEVAAEIAAHPDALVIYSDEDRIDTGGHRFAPYFKPDFDPDLLLGQNYFCHLSVYRRDLLQRLNGLRSGFAGAQDHDLALRATAAVAPSQVRHLPSILYHWRQVGGSVSSSDTGIDLCADASRRAVRDHLASHAGQVEVTTAPLAPQYNRVHWPLPDPAPLVSIIVPTRDRAALLARCLDGVLHRTDYAPIEVLVIDNGSKQPETLNLFAKISADPRVRVLPMPGPFNYAALNNRAAAMARGAVLLLLNNDVDVIDRGWLREMVSQALRPDVGAVGARLLYANGTLQHGGTVLGVGGVANHYRTGAPRHSPGPFGLLALARSASAVTAACLAIRRTVFDAAGGFDQDHLAVAFNDVDLCLRLRTLGYRNVWTPFAELYHLESVSRGQDKAGAAKERFQREQDTMFSRWPGTLHADPYWNPNLSLAEPNGTLACPPRREKPWQAYL
jgi:O-antigen biosynthesis protein